MDAPVTQLDERFSGPGTDPTTWASAREVLEGAQISWISTVRADGRPHVTPLVAVWLDGTDPLLDRRDRAEGRQPRPRTRTSC